MTGFSKNCRTRSRAALVGSPIICLLVLSVCIQAQVAEGGPAPTGQAARYEIRFMTDMIDHHAMAVHTATMCVEKAVHPELLAMCQEIIAVQQQEIMQMQTWLQDWYGITYEPEMGQSDMRMMEKLAALAGAEFEIAFMEMMIKHHFGAIREATRCLDRAFHEELHAMCEDIIVAQAEEIATMREWLCEWYGICRSTPAP